MPSSKTQTPKTPRTAAKTSRTGTYKIETRRDRQTKATTAQAKAIEAAAARAEERAKKKMAEFRTWNTDRYGHRFDRVDLWLAASLGLNAGLIVWLATLVYGG